MKIVICGSMCFHTEYIRLKRELENLGHKVTIPLPNEFYNNSKDVKKDAMEDFNKNLEKSDAMLLANYNKHNTENYVGINSIMEVGMAFNRKKKIFILNKIPDNCKDEFEAAGAVELNGNLSKIK